MHVFANLAALATVATRRVPTGFLAVLTCLLLIAGCSPSPIRYIPESDRTMLQAQARLGESDSSGKPVSVQDILSRARQGDQATAEPSRLLLRFEADDVQPSGAERDQLRQFIETTKTSSVVVSSRPGSFDDPAAPALGQRRALAVSHELVGVVPDVQVRFDNALPPNVVVVMAGTGDKAVQSRAPLPEATP